MESAQDADNTNQQLAQNSSSSTSSVDTSAISSDDVKVGSGSSVMNEQAVSLQGDGVDGDDEKTEEVDDVEQHGESATAEQNNDAGDGVVADVVESESVEEETGADVDGGGNNASSDERKVVEKVVDAESESSENNNDAEQQQVVAAEEVKESDEVAVEKEEEEEEEQQQQQQQQHEEEQQVGEVANEKEDSVDEPTDAKEEGEQLEEDQVEQEESQQATAEEEERAQQEAAEQVVDKAEQNEQAQKDKEQQYKAFVQEREQAAAATEKAYQDKVAAAKAQQEATDAAIAAAEQQAEQEEADKRAEQEAADAATAAASAAIEAAALEEAALIERAANDRATSGGGNSISMSPTRGTLSPSGGSNSGHIHRAESHGEDELAMIRALVNAEENKDAQKLSETYSRLLGTTKESAAGGYENGDSGTNNSDEVDGSELAIDTDSTRQKRRDSYSSGEANGISATSPTRTVQSIGSAVVANILATLRSTRLDEEDSVDQSPPAAPEGLTEEGSVDLALLGSSYERYLLEELLKQVVMDNDTIMFAAAVGSLDFRWWCLACLRARRYRLQRSVDLLRSYAKWRRTADVIVGKKGEAAMQNQLASGFFFTLERARCVNGRGVVVVRMIAHEPRVFNHVQVAKAFHHVLYTALRNESSLQLLGFNFLIDMSGMSIRRFDRKAPEAIFRMINSRFPIRYGKLYVHNAPTSFSIMYKLASLFMTRKMKDRICRVSTRSNAKLIEVVGEDSLPTEFGGKNEVDVEGWSRRVVGDVESETEDNETEDCEEVVQEEEEEEEAEAEEESV